MRWGLGTAGVMALLIATLAPSIGAQWPSYPTPGVPRTADGKPVLDGADAAHAGRQSGLLRHLEARRRRWRWRPRPRPRRAAGADDRRPTASRSRSSARSPAAAIALPLQPWAAELKKKRMADNSKDNPDVWCLPIGLMQYHNHPQPRQIVQTKNLMLITYESNYGLRYIYMDGRPAPNNDPTPWWFGYSRGWYEGDTLVVETTNFRGDERAGWLDVNGSPYTDALKMTERFRRPNFGTLEIDVTIDDAKAYTKPFTVRVNQRHHGRLRR